MAQTIRFARQTDNYSCGPTAIYNLMKLVGYSGNYKQDKKLLHEICKCDKDGMDDKEMSRVLKNLSKFFNDFTVKEYIDYKNFTEEKLHKALAKPKTCAILAIYDDIKDSKEGEGHYFLCLKPKEHPIYYCINYSDKQTVSGLSRKDMKFHLDWHKIKKNKDYPSAWIIRKND